MTYLIESRNTWQKGSTIALLLFVVLPANYVWDLYRARISSAISFWEQSANSNLMQINHDTWQFMLDKYLIESHSSGISRFAYNRVNKKDLSLLNNYLEQLTILDPRLYSDREQQAYWINLYNALTIKLVIEHHPKTSIKEIGQGLPGLGPWDDQIVNIQGRALTLNQIEHGILRPLWKDSRIHFLINCASLGCPSLQGKAVTANNLESLFEQAAREFINHPRAVQFNENTLILSKIFDWFREDFAEDEQGLIQYLANYAEPKLRQALLTFQGEIDYQYNWKLNSPEMSL